MTTQAQDLKTLKAEVKELKSQLETEAAVAQNKADSTIAKAQDAIVRTAHDAGIKAREIFDNKKGQVQELQDAAKTQIQEKPLQTVAATAGVAAVAGVVAAKVLGGSSD